jgi:hypothetical protein
LGWFDTGRVSALIAAFALVGVIYSVIAARAAKAQAVSSDKAATAAVRQAELAKDQVELGRQQIELLLRQIAQGEQAAQDTRRAQRDAMQPTVVVDIAPGLNDPGVFVLTITNYGPSIARNVRIQAPNEMLRSDGTKMHEWSIFSKGIPTMPPGHKMQFFFDVGFGPFKGKSLPSWTFVVDCEGPFGAAPQATYLVDLTPYEGSWAAPTTLSSVVKQLDKVAGSVSKLSRTVANRDTAERLSIEASLAESTEMSSKWTSLTPAIDPSSVKR